MIIVSMLDDLLTTQEEKDSSSLEHIIDIPIDLIDDFEDHPFKVIEDEDLLQLSESIKENGILSPAIIRKKSDGRYEMVAGHRRKKASELAMIEKIPCIVKDLSDEEATILMVDSNIQRDKVFPSEKAFAYKMKLDALKSQGKRTDLTLFQIETKLDNIQKIGEKNNDSRTKVFRYIRLTNLLPDFLNMIDNDVLGKNPKMGFTVGVELSYLSDNEQFILLDAMDCYDATPSHAQAIELKRLSKIGKLNQDVIYKIMSSEKANQIPKFHITKSKLEKVLPKNLKTGEEIEDYIVKAVTDYNRRQRNKENVR